MCLLAGTIGNTCGCDATAFHSDVVPPRLVPMIRKSGAARRLEVAVAADRMARSATVFGVLWEQLLQCLDGA